MLVVAAAQDAFHHSRLIVVYSVNYRGGDVFSTNFNLVSLTTLDSSYFLATVPTTKK